MTDDNFENTPPLLPRSKSKARRTAVIAAAIVVGAALLIVAAHVGRLMLNKAPFEMIMEPANGQAVVYFRQPDKALVSPRFPVNVPCTARTVVVLDSPRVQIPEGSVEFFDTTLLPGDFKIRLGGKRFEIMSSRILVDGQEVQWQKE